jgi:hypothetical protein
MQPSLVRRLQAGGIRASRADRAHGRGCDGRVGGSLLSWFPLPLLLLLLVTTRFLVSSTPFDVACVCAAAGLVLA